VDWQINFQEAVTPIAERVHSFHDLLLVIITAITLFVLALLVWTMIRFNKRANPEPAKFSHGTLVEVVWTVVPVLILVIIAIPSFRLLYYSDVIPEADFTIKTTAQNWYWDYVYPDHGGFEFSSTMLPEDEASAEGLPYLLEVDEKIVVPVNATVRLQVTAGDRLHSWTIPAFGVKMDAVPGRLNETWFQATREGVYYGQCSEICGPRHAYMPIRVDVVSQEEFDAWVGVMQTEYGSNDLPGGALVADASAQLR
jgi:cytochrome c oxidase subunit 2